MDRYAETEGKLAHDALTYSPAAFTDEAEGKMEQDPLLYSPRSAARATATGIPVVGDQGVAVLPGPLIVGAGPAGLACAAKLTIGGVSTYALLERDVCVASMWHRRTYRRLRLHLPKHFCELPLMPFPDDYPTYPTRQQFLTYMDNYKLHFGIRPFFRQEVVAAEHDGEYWCVRTKDAMASSIDSDGEESIISSAREYRSKWLIVATGENAEPAVPDIEGLHSFKGQILHSSDYRSGETFQGKKVLVVGHGNSGMEVSLDLANHNVHTSIVVRNSVRNYTVYSYYC